MPTQTLKPTETLSTESGNLTSLQREELDLSRFLFDLYGPSFKGENETIIASAIRLIKKLRAEVFNLKAKKHKS